MPIQIITGDIIESKEKYICHQCNCLTNHAAGIAKTIFERFPYADIYASRKGTQYDPKHLIPGHEPGKIIVCGNGKDQRYIVNMFGQLYPGKPKFPQSKIDGTVARRNYFRSCLQALTNLSELDSISFPFKIGCNMAGGNWDDYKNDLDVFASHIKKPVTIYQLP